MISIFDVYRLAEDFIGAAVFERLLVPANSHSLGPASNIGAGCSVLLIPGLGASDSHMEVLRLRLRQNGFDVHLSGIEDNIGDYRHYRESLLGLARGIVDKSGQPLAVVGHGMGGRYGYWMLDEEPNLFWHLITLGTPRAALSKEMLANLPLKEHLRDEMSQTCPLPQAGIKLTAVIGVLDGIVRRQDAELTQEELRAGDRKNIFVPTWHVAMPMQWEIANVVIERLLPGATARQPGRKVVDKDPFTVLATA